jgi:hypothetical protein
MMKVSQFFEDGNGRVFCMRCLEMTRGTVTADLVRAHGDCTGVPDELAEPLRALVQAAALAEPPCDGKPCERCQRYSTEVTLRPYCDRCAEES